MAEINLPDDIIYQILLKLPVKTLLRFHSLSTNWNKTIRSCDFAKEHWLLQFGSETASCTRHVLLMCNSAGFSYRCGFGLNTDYTTGQVMTVKVDLPFKKYLDGQPGDYWSGASSSCHGLLCLIYYCNDEVIFFIWNPLTNYYKEVALPQELYVPSDHLEIKNNAFVGFGYDHVINDYKLVFYIKTLGDCCYVMTLSTNVWRKIDAPLWQHFFQCSYWRIGVSPVFIRGDLFWIVKDSRKSYLDAILKFNLVEESLSTGFLPGREIKISCGPFTFCSKLTQYRGSLCYCIYVFNQDYFVDEDSIIRGYHGRFIGWTLEHSDVITIDSWYNFIDQWKLLAPTRGNIEVEPVGFDRDGDIAIMSIDRGRGLAAFRHGKNNKLVKLNLCEQVKHIVQDVHYLEMESLFCP